jgi:hypothetical protein
MRMLPFGPEKRQEWIKLALEEKAPRTYRQLVKEGKLQKFLKDHDRAMMAAYNPEEVAIQAARHQDGPNLDRAVNQALHRYTEEVLATWLEFSDPPTTGSPQEK